MCVSQQTVQNSSRDGNATLPSSWETYMQLKKQQLEPNMGQETVLKIGKRVSQGCILSPYLFNFYAYYIMRNAGLDEAQVGVKILGKNINNLRYINDTTLKSESEAKLKHFLIKVTEESEKDGVKLNSQKTKTTSSNPITSQQWDRATMETVEDYFPGLKSHCRWWFQPWI